MSGGGDPRVHRYGDGEFLLSYGASDGPQLIVIQPFFEEMNRCRAFVAALCRRLADAGFGCWLPDLPGTGESTHALEEVGWDDWREALAAVAERVARGDGRPAATIAIRGGALLDATLPGPCWRFAPTTGRSLLSDLRRSALASGGDPAAPAGYRLSPGLAAALEAAEPAADTAARTLRLTSDNRPADRTVEGASLWRRPEPARDDALARVLAEDIAAWLSA